MVLNVVSAIRKNEKLFGMTVSHLDLLGHGVVPVKCKQDHRTFFPSFPRTLPGERVTLAVSNVQVTLPPGRRKPIREYQFDMIPSLSPSPDEVPVACDAWKRGCTGCQFLNLSAQGQLKEKHFWASEKMRKFGKIPPIPGISSPRNFARLKFGSMMNLKHGMKTNSCENLEISLSAAAHEALAALSVLPAFDDRRGTGFVKELVLRSVGDEVLLGVITVPGHPVLTQQLAVIAESLAGDSKWIRGVSIAVSGGDDDELNTCNDVSFDSFFGLESLSCNGISLKLSTEAFTSVSTLFSVCEKLKNLEKCLVVNAGKNSFIRQLLTDSVYLNHCTENSPSTTAQIFADLLSEVDISVDCSSVLVMGDFSEKLRNWVVENSRFNQIIFVTEDIDKVVHNAEKLKRNFTASSLDFFDAERHCMRSVVVAIFTR